MIIRDGTPMPKGELVHEEITRMNKWSIYKVNTTFSAELRVYKNGEYQFMCKDLRWAIDECKKRG